jgi:5-amino-6-(5-phospho-D-ribitylamino)uracil phosphatase
MKIRPGGTGYPIPNPRIRSPMPAPSVDIIAIDLDGTLLGNDGKVSNANRDAIEHARAAGVLVLPCTGRGFVECSDILADINAAGPAVVAGGAMICDGKTGQTLHRFNVSPAITNAATGFIHEAGHAALVLKDSTTTGHDYLVVTGDGDHPVDPVSIWWFETHSLSTRFVRSLDEDEHPDATVRVGLVADAHDSVPLMQRMAQSLGSEVLLHSFPALVNANAEQRHGREVHVLEVFDKRAHKWSAIEWVASETPLLGSRVAAIGDHINDVSMLKGADIGIAMGNAAEPARKAADVITRTNADDGVAFAIDQLLSGNWAGNR